MIPVIGVYNNCNKQRQKSFKRVKYIVLSLKSPNISSLNNLLANSDDNCFSRGLYTLQNINVIDAMCIMFKTPKAILKVEMNHFLNGFQYLYYHD